MIALLTKLFGNRNTRIIKRYQKKVQQINLLSHSYQQLSLDALQEKSHSLKDRVAHSSLDELLPESFALVREASDRILGLRHFDVQLLGGIALHEGNIAEMHTGEGKTLVATLPVYLHALAGKGVHVVTVNDYLALRDSTWMKPLYEFLGLSVGLVIGKISPEQRREAYMADITYATNHELGFDYLRDHMVMDEKERVQRSLHYAIIDEVDSILIDEARTPLIISGASQQSSELYYQIDQLAGELKQQAIGYRPEDDPNKENEHDFIIDEKDKLAFLTDQGHHRVEEWLIKHHQLAPGKSLYHPAHLRLMHHVLAMLRAHYLFQKDTDYVIQNQQVMIVDEHTGRLMSGRRWSDGLHQAIEAKEKVPIQQENLTLASITYQNFFRLYHRLAGMTGTADTEAFEFQNIYQLEVVVIPTNRPNQRRDHPDIIFADQESKYQAIIKTIQKMIEKQQPVLAGTVSIEQSEQLSEKLRRAGIKHQVLNAKYHEQEAQIIAEAGQPGAVTIATNMAGRGTDIVLGGNLRSQLDALPPEATDAERQALSAAWQIRHRQVVDAGGLFVLGSERHESRRIDNQLRGRSGRQGDPGESQFYLSLEDTLMRLFAAPKFSQWIQRGLKEGESLMSPMLSKAVARAQAKVEGKHFDIRKQLLEFDDVANEQRLIVYQTRDDMLLMDNPLNKVKEMGKELLQIQISTYLPAEMTSSLWNIVELQQALHKFFQATIDIENLLKEQTNLSLQDLSEYLWQQILNSMLNLFDPIDLTTQHTMVRQIMLHVLDTHWQDHLTSLEELRRAVGLRGYAQRDPKQEYKRDAFILFSDFLQAVREEIIQLVWRQDWSHSAIGHTASTDPVSTIDSSPADISINQLGISRNQLCPCGSGKKFKHCHGQLVLPKHTHEPSSQ